MTEITARSSPHVGPKVPHGDALPRHWITGERGTVLEEVLIEHAGQRILFLGRETLQIDGGRLRASNFQPLFHVEHTAGGSVDDPLNLWSIVILTPEWDERYTKPFKEMAEKDCC